MMNLYQCLAVMGHAPEECLDKPVVTVFKSRDWHLGIGLFNMIMVAEEQGKEYKPFKRMNLDFVMLNKTPKEILCGTIEAYKMIEGKGYEIKGDDEFNGIQEGGEQKEKP